MIRALGLGIVVPWAVLSLSNAVPAEGWAASLIALTVALGMLGCILAAYFRGRSHMAAEMAALARAAQLAGTDGGP